MARTSPLLCLLLVAACGHHGGGGGGDDAGSYSSIRIDPDTVSLTVAIAGSATEDYTVLGTDDSGEHDITADCTLSVDQLFGTFSGATLTAKPHGGETQVRANCGASGTATSALKIALTGTIVVGQGVPPDADQIFGSATLGSDPNRTPGLEYPLDGAVAPVNLPSIESQWTAGGNDLFHLILESTYETIDVYVATPQAMLATADWESIIYTAAGEGLTITVEGLAQATPDTKFASTPVDLVISHDTIDTSAIYWWASSQGSIMSQTFGKTDAPTPIIANCTACHALSRSGSRIGYSRCVNGSCNGEYVGFLHYDRSLAQWVEVVNADNMAIQGTYTTFAPVGNPFPNDDQSIAMVTLQAGAAAGTLGLYDPDTGQPVASNLASVMVPNTSALMPDWSPDGASVVFAQTPHASQTVDVSDSSIATMSYLYSGGQHVFGAPQTLVASPITLGGQSYSNLFFPSFSPDGELVVFNAARASWRNFSDARTAGQRLALVRTGGGTPMDLTALDGTGDLDITWPHWAPGSTTDYYWLVFSSERDYGHEVTGTNTAAPCVANGVTQCKQIWIGAISKQALIDGAIDPSAPPVWLPGQDTQADNISPYWTVPAGVQ